MGKRTKSSVSYSHCRSFERIGPEFWDSVIKRVRKSKTLEELRDVIDDTVNILKTHLKERKKACV